VESLQYLTIRGKTLRWQNYALANGAVFTLNGGIAMRRLGVDGHILTGKHQGSNAWLVNVIAHAAKRDPDTVYVVYSFDPEMAKQILNGPNIEHRALPFRGLTEVLLPHGLPHQL